MVNGIFYIKISWKSIILFHFLKVERISTQIFSFFIDIAMWINPGLRETTMLDSKGMYDKHHITEEPDKLKGCAVKRIKLIANWVSWSSGQWTPRRTTNLNSKEKGDKSMFVKRELTEDVYVNILQRLSDKAIDWQNFVRYLPNMAFNSCAK